MVLFVLVLGPDPVFRPKYMGEDKTMPPPLATSDFLSHHGIPRVTWEKCHGGEGPYFALDLLKGANQTGMLRMFHDNVIPPGTTFGFHTHGGEEPLEEWYVCLEGEGTLNLDGVERPFRSGELGVCRQGGSHGLRNDGPTPMRLLVFFIRLPRSEP